VALKDLHALIVTHGYESAAWFTQKAQARGLRVYASGKPQVHIQQSNNRDVNYLHNFKESKHFVIVCNDKQKKQNSNDKHIVSYSGVVNIL